MKIEKIPLILPNVIKLHMDLSKNDFDKGLEKMQEIEYKENVYGLGMLVFKTLYSKRNDEMQPFDFYLSVTNVPEDFPYETVKLLMVQNTVVFRQANEEKSLEEARQKLETFVSKNYKQELSDEMYVVNYELYDDSLIDFYIPIKEREKN